MRGYQDGEDRIEHEPWEPPDPDLVEDMLKVLDEESRIGFGWYHHVTMDPVELRRSREMAKVILARYGKQSILQWDNVEVAQIQRYANRLVELIKSEHSTARVTED